LHIYDIVIIGAGPAGTTLARELAAAGHGAHRRDGRILLIDGQNEKLRKPCGGLLAPDAQKVLAHFDLVLPKRVLADPQIFAVKTIDLQSRLVRYYQRYYLNMDRYAFDRWLFDLVPPEVAKLAGRCRKIEREGKHLRLTVHTAEGPVTVLCHRLVGADGADSIVRRTFFSRPAKQYTAIQQWFQNTDHDADQSIPYYSCIFDPETSDSCSWLIHKEDKIIFGGCFDAHNCRQMFDRQKERLSAFLGYRLDCPLRTEACLVDSPEKKSDFITGKDNIYLVGEAAGLISASSFEGISSAILSADLLAQTLAAQLPAPASQFVYRSRTRALRFRLTCKILKRRILYTPWLRALIMRSGIGSIQVRKNT